MLTSPWFFDAQIVTTWLLNWLLCPFGATEITFCPEIIEYSRIFLCQDMESFSLQEASALTGDQNLGSQEYTWESAVAKELLLFLGHFSMW